MGGVETTSSEKRLIPVRPRTERLTNSSDRPFGLSFGDKLFRRAFFGIWENIEKYDMGSEWVYRSIHTDNSNQRKTPTVLS